MRRAPEVRFPWQPTTAHGVCKVFACLRLPEAACCLDNGAQETVFRALKPTLFARARVGTGSVRAWSPTSFAGTSCTAARAVGRARLLLKNRSAPTMRVRATRQIPVRYLARTGVCCHLWRCEMRVVAVMSALAFALATSASAQVPDSPLPQSGGSVQIPAKKPKLSHLEFDAAKARAAMEARERAWDARTKKSMNSICTGC
jgi:hypothetical protein